MSDLIDSAQAKLLLGCDDATLKGYIANGSIRTQNQGGKMLILKEDVERLAGDDGTIVITGDSSELQIDLEKAAQAAGDQAKTGTQSITFGDDLEVVSFDDTSTKDIKFGQGTPAAAPKLPTSRKNQSQGVHTEANTEVMTAVDEPQIDVSEATESTSKSSRRDNASARRSVRSSRAYTEEASIAPIWAVVMLATLGIAGSLALPYTFLSLTPSGIGKKDYAGNAQRGADDGFMAGLAAMASGFSAEPDRNRYKTVHGSDEGYLDIKNIDNSAEWRSANYLKKYKGGTKSFLITEVVESDDAGNPTKVKSANGDMYPVAPQEVTTPAGKTMELKVQMNASTEAAPAAEAAPAPTEEAAPAK